MDWCYFLLLFFFGTHIQNIRGVNRTHGSEHQLIRKLLQTYTPDSRPVRNASSAVTVTFALGLNQLLDLDEKNQVLSTSVWIYEKWKDEQLVWSPADFGNREILMIPASCIWLPDIFIFNAAGETADGFVRVNGSKVAVQSDGTISWMVPLMIKSACPVDVTYFPYDRQTCYIKFSSWIYDMNQLNILIDSHLPDMEQYVMNSEYDLENASISRGVVDSSCCPGEGRHSVVELRVQLKRKSLYYDYIVIAPTIMLCVLTLVSFMLPCDKGEKIAIGLNVFLTLYVLQLRIADNVPDTNSTPILGVFMLSVMTFNCISLIMATLVMNINKRGDNSEVPDVPNWLFQLCDRGLGRIVCTLWKRTEYIPLSVPEFVEQETAFDGPDGRETTEENTNTGVSDDVNNIIAPENGAVKPPQLPMPKRRPEFVGSASGQARHMRGRHDSATGFSQFPYTDNQGHLYETVGQSTPSRAFGMDNLRSRRDNGIYGGQDKNRSAEEHIKSTMSLPWKASDIQLLENLRRVNLSKRRWFYVAEVVDKFAFLMYLFLLTICIFTVLYLIPVHFQDD